MNEEGLCIFYIITEQENVQKLIIAHRITEIIPLKIVEVKLCGVIKYPDALPDAGV
jgi:hypothetical protein